MKYENISTLEELAAYINSRDDWDTLYLDDIIQCNGWKKEQNGDAICSDNEDNILVIDDCGHANVFNLRDLEE